ncbi:MAG TPA: 16S rRNA (guanine(966)-N(2))-methyltransferase RsmD [Actinomycetes bacterium]|nr:16S rRNA (guanine(966)-N(2))-methyltransferase RsmD [Actinomycetes bacterium]
MPRIIGGSAGGRRVNVPRSMRSRPTSDRAKEGLLGTLEDLVGLARARVADFYAGSGSVGLEMLSRGAAHCLFVESDPRVAEGIRRNVRQLGLQGAEVLTARAETTARTAPAAEPYDVIFLDPPYPIEVDAVLADLCRNGWLARDGLLAVERSSRSPEPDWPDSLDGVRSRRYGDATMWYARHT